MASLFQKTKVKLELLTDVGMLLMVEKKIRGGICHTIYRYAKANNKYMKNYNKDKEESLIQYLDPNNLYSWAVSQKLPVSGFKWKKNMSKFTKEFIKNYDKDSDKGYILEVDVKYPKKLHDLHSNIPFSPERMKIDKCKKLVSNLYNKEKYFVHIRSLKQGLSHGLILKKVHRVIQFNQEAWLKPYIDMNTELKRKAKNDFEKDFFKLMNNAVFGKTMENVRKHRDMKLVKTDRRRNELVPKPNYHAIKWFSKNLVAIEMKKTKVKMNNPIYLGLSILEISKILMYEFWYDYMKPKYGDNVKLCYMDTDSFIIYIKTEDFYKVIADDEECKFDASNYEVDGPLPAGKNKKVMGLIKDELGGKIMTEFVALRSKLYSYLTDDFEEDKKAKGTKKCVIKIELKLTDYKDCLLNDKAVLKSQQRFKSEKHDVYTEGVNKIALSNNDNERLVAFDKITTYPYGYKGKHVREIC